MPFQEPALPQGRPFRRRAHFSPAQVLVFTFVVLIGAGTALLALPVSATGSPLSVVDALFTATSAVCVTGLIVVDTPVALSTFGQTVVLLLIQVGGLGYMAITTVVGLAIGRQLTMHERLTLKEALNVDTMEGLARFVLTVLKFILAFELAGAVILTIAWSDSLGWGRAAWFGVFHAVSAFNNAGFSLFSDNLMGYRDHWVVSLTVCGLVICGGLGFVVLTELRRRHKWRELSGHTRLVLGLTAALLVVATVFIFAVERGNPRTLGALGAADAGLAAFFHAVMPRTAGFNSVDIGALHHATLFVMLILMFIGAAPGGTAGGVKVTTFSITVAVIWSIVRGAAEPTLMGRRIGAALVARAFSICLLGLLALNLVAVALLVTEGRNLMPTLFEATSAFGTVGLSMGEGAVVSLAAHFSTSGKVLLVALMIMGRVGPLTLAVAIGRFGAQARVRYPEGRFLVG